MQTTVNANRKFSIDQSPIAEDLKPIPADQRKVGVIATWPCGWGMALTLATSPWALL